MEATVLRKKQTLVSAYMFALAGKDKFLVYQDDCNFNILDTNNGDIIEVERIENTPRGLKGYGVTWKSRTGNFYEFTGTIVNIDYDRKFAIAQCEHGDIFLHVREFEDYNETSPTFEMLTRGSSVSGYYRQTQKGLRGYKVRASAEL